MAGAHLRGGSGVQLEQRLLLLFCRLVAQEGLRLFVRPCIFQLLELRTGRGATAAGRLLQLLMLRGHRAGEVELGPLGRPFLAGDGTPPLQLSTIHGRAG